MKCRKSSRKRRAYRKMLKGNVAEEVKGRRKREYKACRNQVKRMVRENKRKVDEEFGRALCDKYRENKKLFWMNVRKDRGGESVRMKCEGGVVVGAKDAVRGVWK